MANQRHNHRLLRIHLHTRSRLISSNPNNLSKLSNNIKSLTSTVRIHHRHRNTHIPTIRGYRQAVTRPLSETVSENGMWRLNSRKPQNRVSPSM